jgi:hypothetical protein
MNQTSSNHQNHHKKNRIKMINSIQLPDLQSGIIKGFTDHWHNKLGSKPTSEEIALGSDTSVTQYKPVSCRATIGLDIYESNTFVKQMGNITLSQVYKLFDDAVQLLSFPKVNESIIEEDVIACASISKHKKQSAIELAREKRVLTSKCQTIQWSDIEKFSSNETDSNFFHLLFRSQFGNVKRINETLFRLSALRCRITVGKWSPPPLQLEEDQSQHTKEVVRQFASFRSLIRKKERRRKFLQRRQYDDEADDEDDNNKEEEEKEEKNDISTKNSTFLTQQIDLFEDVDALPSKPLAEEAYRIRSKELGVLPLSRISNVFHHGDQKLLLPHYGLGNGGCDALCHGIALNRGLKIIDLSSNQLNSQSMIVLAKSLLSRMKNESELEILPHEKLISNHNNTTSNKYESKYAGGKVVREDTATATATDTDTATDTIQGIPPTIYKLKLDDNNAKAEGALAIFSICGAMQELQTLSMNKNNIDASLLASYHLNKKKEKHVSSSLAKQAVQHKDLRHRGSIGNLGRNHLHRHEHHIEASNRIRSPICSGIIMMLERHSSLTKLHLNNNKLGDSGATSIGDAIVHNIILKDLQLNWNVIGPSGATAMSHGLKKNRSLEQIGLGWNALGNSGATSIAECMASTLSIRHLDLRHNHIQTDGIYTSTTATTINTK